jgi:hypothetical protein
MGILKKIQFFYHKTTGNEEKYFQTQDDIILDNAKKLLSKYSLYDNSLDNNSLDDNSLDDNSLDNSEIIKDIYSFMPMEVLKTKLFKETYIIQQLNNKLKNSSFKDQKEKSNIEKKINYIELIIIKRKGKEVNKWLRCIKSAKHQYDLEGIPYDWISNDGKVKIHKKARDLYIYNYEHTKNIHSAADLLILAEMNKEMDKIFPQPPKHDPIISQKKK